MCVCVCVCVACVCKPCVCVCVCVRACKVLGFVDLQNKATPIHHQHLCFHLTMCSLATSSGFGTIPRCNKCFVIIVIASCRKASSEPQHPRYFQLHNNHKSLRNSQSAGNLPQCMVDNACIIYSLCVKTAIKAAQLHPGEQALRSQTNRVRYNPRTPTRFELFIAIYQ